MRLQADSIDRQFLSYLYKNKDFLISPTRIPTSLIGWASNTLYITALMLERAPFSCKLIEFYLNFYVIFNDFITNFMISKIS
jgi:hypothetical protein